MSWGSDPAAGLPAGGTLDKFGNDISYRADTANNYPKSFKMSAIYTPQVNDELRDESH